MLTYMGVSVSLDGIDNNFAFYLVPIANSLSLVGRLGAGFFADKIDPFNSFLACP